MYYKRCTGAILVQKSTEMPEWVQWTHHSEGKTHCEECLMLDGCWFAGDAHPHLFDPENVYQHGKNKAFENWGYTVKDAKWLQEEIERQAREKYVSDEYTLGKLDIRGQRINIRVTIPRKDDSGDVSFITGWMVLPNGKLKLNTPYGGK